MTYINVRQHVFMINGIIKVKKKPIINTSPCLSVDHLWKVPQCAVDVKSFHFGKGHA